MLALFEDDGALGACANVSMRYQVILSSPPRSCHDPERLGPQCCPLAQA